MVLGGREVFLPLLEENIEAVIGCGVDDEIAEIDRRLAEQQKELLNLANAKKDYSKVADEIDRLRAEKQAILMREADRDRQTAAHRRNESLSAGTGRYTAGV